MYIEKPFLERSNQRHLTACQKVINWVKKNSVDGGIIHSASIRKPYPEVTGYFIPSLLKWGEKELAHSYADWLVSIQTPEGAWQDLELKTPYTFDTGQILKGLYEMIPYDQKYEEAFLKGCNWLLNQIDIDGRICTPSTSLYGNIGNENIHLYTLEPLKKAGEKYGRSDYLEGVNNALSYYLSNADLTKFNILAHFHAYIVESLIDLDQKERALKALISIKKFQRANGAIPAFPNVRWVCLVALLQYAVCYYKLGMLHEGDILLDYVTKKQQPTGGFFGGSGWFVKYFKNVEISWACKYMLDAVQLRLGLDSKDSNNQSQSISV